MAAQTQNALGYTPEQYKRFRRYGVRYLLLYSALYCFLYCMRLNLSGAGAAMTAQLHWTSAQIGILTGTMFWTYALGQLLTGRLSELLGTSRFVMLSVLLSAAANLLLGFQSSLVVMAILWGCNGLFQAMAWAPGIAALTNWWPGNRRGFATGFAQAFSGFGQAAATLSVALAFALLPAQGWRAAFRIPAAFPLVALVFFAAFTKESPEKAGLPAYRESDPDREANEQALRALLQEKGKLYPFRYLLSDKKFLLWVLIAFLVGLARYGLITWIPMYFTDRFGMDITKGLLQSLTLPVGMGVGSLVVPWLTDRFCPTNRLPAVILSAFAGAAAVGGIVFLDPRQTAQAVLLQILLFTAGFFIYAINGVAWAYATDVGGRVFSGTSSGLLNFSAYTGAAVQSFLYGFLLRSLGWNMVFVSVAALCVCVALLGVAGAVTRKSVATTPS